MRRFLVQAAIDGLISVAVVFALSLIDITQPFPFGQELRADHPAGRRQHPRLLRLGRDLRAGQPRRPTGPGGGVRAMDLLDARAVRRRDHRPDDPRHVTAVPGPDRRRGRPAATLAPPRRRALHPRLHPRRHRARAQPAARRRARRPLGLDVPGLAAHAAAQHDHREPAAPAGVRGAVPDQHRHRVRGNADRQHSALVRASHPRRDPPDGRRERAQTRRGAPPAAGADVREDRPDAGRPLGPAARRLDDRVRPAAGGRGAVPLVGRRRGDQGGARSTAGRGLRVDRGGAVRRRLDRAGPPRHARRRDARRGQDPAAHDRRQDQGRPRRHAGAGEDGRAALRASLAGSGSGRSSASSRPASSRSSTTGTRPITPDGSPTRWRSSSRSTSRSSTRTCRPAAC